MIVDEIKAFIDGMKPGLIRPRNCRWAKENFDDYYSIFHKERGFIMFHERTDFEEYLRTKRASGLGKLLGYPPVAYEKWEELCRVDWDRKQVVNYHGIRFVCFNEDVETAIAWMEEHRGKGKIINDDVQSINR